MYHHAFFTPSVCEQVSLYHPVGPVWARDYSLAQHCLTVLIIIQYSRASTWFSPVLVLCFVLWCALCKSVLFKFTVLADTAIVRVYHCHVSSLTMLYHKLILWCIHPGTLQIHCHSLTSCFLQLLLHCCCGFPSWDGSMGSLCSSQKRASRFQIDREWSILPDTTRGRGLYTMGYATCKWRQSLAGYLHVLPTPLSIMFSNTLTQS